MRGDLPRALASLEGALGLAEPEGYVRMFVDEGAPMAALLAEAADHLPMWVDSEPPWARRLIVHPWHPTLHGAGRSAERPRA